MGENGVLWVSSAVNFPVVCSCLRVALACTPKLERHHAERALRRSRDLLGQEPTSPSLRAPNDMAIWANPRQSALPTSLWKAPRGTIVRKWSQASYRARRDRVLMCSARASHVGVKGATCDLSELDLRSQRRRVVSGGDTFVPPQDAQRQLRPRRVDGCTPRHLLCATVYSAGS